MLILTRRTGESITLEIEGTLAEVTVLGIRGNQVRLGIDAPEDVEVHRLEIYNKIQRQKQDEEEEEDYDD